MSKKVKLFAIIILVLAAIIWAASYFGSSTSTPSTSSLSSSVDTSKVAGVLQDGVGAPPSEFSNVLASIKSITLDTAIFDDPAYRALRDYPITLGSDTRGRPNPFAPVGVDVGTISGGRTAQPDVQFETLQPAKVTATTAELGAQAILSSTDQAFVVFEYGLTDMLGSATDPVPLGKSGTALIRITGLTPKTTYYVRARLAQGSISKTGNSMTFTTPAK